MRFAPPTVRPEHTHSGRTSCLTWSQPSRCSAASGSDATASHSAPTTRCGRKPSAPCDGQCRMLTARAMTRSEVRRAETLSRLIRSLARVDRGMVSVGLKAVELVTDTYR